MKKLTTVVTMLVLLTLLAAPLVFAQEDTSVGSSKPASGLQALYYVNCGQAYPAPFGDFVYGLPVYENGLVGLPDGSMVPLSEIAVADTCAVPMPFGASGG